MQGLFQAPWRGFDTGVFGQGFGPASFAGGDLDGDGDLDILVGDSFFSSPGISVLKNNGDQSFAEPVYYPVPRNEVVGEVALSYRSARRSLLCVEQAMPTYSQQTESVGIGGDRCSENINRADVAAS